MNADDEKKLQDEFFNCGGDVVRITNFAFALGRARGMTESAGICRAQRIGIDAFGGIDCHIDMTRDQCAAAIEKARDA